MKVKLDIAQLGLTKGLGISLGDANTAAGLDGKGLSQDAELQSFGRK